MNPLDEKSILDAEDIFSTIRSIGDDELFSVVYAIHDAEEPALTVEGIAQKTTLGESEVERRLEELTDAGSVDTRMACLISEDCDGEQYELTEFGRILLEEGVLTLFKVANEATANE